MPNGKCYDLVDKEGKSIMGKGQKARKIGNNMKPRGNKEVKPQKETREMTEQSTAEGHETPPKEAVLEPQEGNETPGNLETENGAAEFQNLENSETSLAHDDGLEAALNESGEAVIDAEFSEVDESPELIQVLGEPYGVDLETAMAVGTGTIKDLQPPLGGKSFLIVGLQPDGSTKVIVAIPEGVFEPVNELAKDRGITLERWCNEFFQEALDAYFSPAGKR